jgi:hypothetical protein
MGRMSKRSTIQPSAAPAMAAQGNATHGDTDRFSATST